MGDLKNITGKYMGKILKSDGEKNGNKYQKFQLKFLIDNKERNFSAFLPWIKKDGEKKKGISIDDLNEGENYKLGYTEYQAEGMEYPSKTIASIFPDDGRSTPSTSEKPTTSGLNLPDATTLVRIAELYKTKVKPEEKNLNHFIGTIFMTTSKKELAALITAFENIVEKIEAEEIKDISI